MGNKVDHPQDPGRTCEAMDKAGIANPNSNDGIHFCIEKCPYPHCVVYEPKKGRPNKESYKTKEVNDAIISMMNNVSIMDIALSLGISVKTVERTIRARLDKSD